MVIGELAAYVAEHLRQSDINVVLTGGSCVSIYTDNRYQSYDLDFIEDGFAGRKKIAAVLTKQSTTDFCIKYDGPGTCEMPIVVAGVGGECSEVKKMLLGPY
jgi:hypothetical protein